MSTFWIFDDIKELILLLFSFDHGVVLFPFSEPLSFRDTSGSVSRRNDIMSVICLKIILKVGVGRDIDETRLAMD